MSPISRNQIIRLQTLYGQLAAHAQEGNDRASRLRLASEHTGRAIVSFRGTPRRSRQRDHHRRAGGFRADPVRARSARLVAGAARRLATLAALAAWPSRQSIHPHLRRRQLRLVGAETYG